MRTEDIERLRSIIGDAERVSVKDADLDAHSADESPHEPHKPEAVVWVESAQGRIPSRRRARHLTPRQCGCRPLRGLGLVSCSLPTG